MTKLTPNTRYEVVGNFQYLSEEGDLIEVNFTKQEFTTGSKDGLNPIELNITNGKIYSNEIEFSNLNIFSNIEDEPIYYVKTAQIIVNGSKNYIDGISLRNILNGKRLLNINQTLH